jgi:hypothetical protein
MSALLLGAVAGALSAQETGPLAPPVYARVSSEPIGEMSGIVKSRRRDNVYWVHNDSGDSARIFAIDSTGKTILPTYSRFTRYGEEPEQGKEQWQGFEVLYAKHVDWEDIAIDESYLYVADVGNNGNARRDLVIYMLSEIDPTASTRTAVIKKLPVVYPDQTDYPPPERNFDSESLFVDAGTLYLITKHRGAGLDLGFAPGAKLYRLDTAYDDRNNVLTPVDSHPALTAATGAELSPDGQTLAVLATSELWLFTRPESGDKWLSAGASRHFALNRDIFRQAEAVTWDGDGALLITNEQRDIFRLELAALPNG